jgi:ubiquitin-activating enzyme E1
VNSRPSHDDYFLDKSCMNFYHRRSFIPKFYSTASLCQIAGRIVPALATTTALVAGLSALEIVKIATENILRRRIADPGPSSESFSGSENTRIVKKFRNSFVNLARPLLAFAQPVEAETFSVSNRVFNMWSVIEVRQR